MVTTSQQAAAATPTTREERQAAQLAANKAAAEAFEKASAAGGGGLGTGGYGEARTAPDPKKFTNIDLTSPAGRALYEAYKESGVVIDSNTGNVIYNPADLGAREVEVTRAAQGLPPSSKTTGEPSAQYAYNVAKQSSGQVTQLRSQFEQLQKEKAHSQDVIRMTEANIKALQGELAEAQRIKSDKRADSILFSLRAEERQLAQYKKNVQNIDAAIKETAQAEMAAKKKQVQATIQFAEEAGRITEGPKPIKNAFGATATKAMQMEPTTPQRPRAKAITGVKEKLFASPTFMQEAETYTRPPSFLGDVRKERQKAQTGITDKLFQSPTFVTKEQQREKDRTFAIGKDYTVSFTENITTQKPRAPQAFAVSLSEGPPPKPKKITQEEFDRLSPENQALYNAQAIAYNQWAEAENKRRKQKQVESFIESKKEILAFAEEAKKQKSLITINTTKGTIVVTPGNAYRKIIENREDIIGIGIMPTIPKGYTLAGSLESFPKSLSLIPENRTIKQDITGKITEEYGTTPPTYGPQLPPQKDFLTLVGKRATQITQSPTSNELQKTLAAFGQVGIETFGGLYVLETKGAQALADLINNTGTNQTKIIGFAEPELPDTVPTPIIGGLTAGAKAVAVTRNINEFAPPILKGVEKTAELVKTQSPTVTFAQIVGNILPFGPSPVKLARAAFEVVPEAGLKSGRFLVRATEAGTGKVISASFKDYTKAQEYAAKLKKLPTAESIKITAVQETIKSVQIFGSNVISKVNNKFVLGGPLRAGKQELVKAVEKFSPTETFIGEQNKYTRDILTSPKGAAALEEAGIYLPRDVKAVQYEKEIANIIKKERRFLGEKTYDTLSGIESLKSPAEQKALFQEVLKSSKVPVKGHAAEIKQVRPEILSRTPRTTTGDIDRDFALFTSLGKIGLGKLAEKYSYEAALKDVKHAKNVLERVGKTAEAKQKGQITKADLLFRESRKLKEKAETILARKENKIIKELGKPNGPEETISITNEKSMLKQAAKKEIRGTELLEKVESVNTERGFEIKGTKLYAGEKDITKPLFDIKIPKGSAAHGTDLKSAKQILKEGGLDPYKRPYGEPLAFASENPEIFKNFAGKGRGTPAIVIGELEKSGILPYKKIPKSIRKSILRKLESKSQRDNKYEYEVYQEELKKYAKEKGYIGFTKPYKSKDPNAEKYEIGFFEKGQGFKPSEIVTPAGYGIKGHGDKVLENLTHRDIEDVGTSRGKDVGQVYGTKYKYDIVKSQGRIDKGVKYRSLADQTLTKLNSISNIFGPRAEKFTGSGSPDFLKGEIQTTEKGFTKISKIHRLKDPYDLLVEDLPEISARLREAGRTKQANRLDILIQEEKKLYPEIDFSITKPIKETNIYEPDTSIPSFFSRHGVTPDSVISKGAPAAVFTSTNTEHEKETLVDKILEPIEKTTDKILLTAKPRFTPRETRQNSVITKKEESSIIISSTPSSIYGSRGIKPSKITASPIQSRLQESRPSFTSSRINTSLASIISSPINSRFESSRPLSVESPNKSLIQSPIKSPIRSPTSPIKPSPVSPFPASPASPLTPSPTSPGITKGPSPSLKPSPTISPIIPIIPKLFPLEFPTPKPVTGFVPKVFSETKIYPDKSPKRTDFLGNASEEEIALGFNRTEIITGEKRTARQLKKDITFGRKLTGRTQKLITQKTGSVLSKKKQSILFRAKPKVFKREKRKTGGFF